MQPRLKQWLGERLRRPWRFGFAFLGLVLLGLGAGAGVLHGWALHHFQAAHRALEHFDFDQAQEHLNRCLLIWPRSASTRLLAARTARRRGALDEAEYHLGACERLQGITPESALERILLRAQKGDLTGVRGLLEERLARGDPAEATLILEAVSQGALRALQLPETMASLEDLLERQPAHYPALTWRGRLAESLSRFDQARDDFERAVAIQPEYDAARLGLAHALSELGRTREAAGQYECLYRRQPGNPDVVLGLARCRHDLHELNAAREVLDKLLLEHPDHVPALVERGRLALHSGRVAEAEGFLYRGIALAPHDRDAHFVLHLCLEAEGKRDEAAACLARLREIEDEGTRVTTLIAKALDAPHDPALRHQVGVLLVRGGQEELGRRWLASALQQDPNYAPARAALADLPRSPAKDRGPRPSSPNLSPRSSAP